MDSEDLTCLIAIEAETFILLLKSFASTEAGFKLYFEFKVFHCLDCSIKDLSYCLIENFLILNFKIDFHLVSHFFFFSKVKYILGFF
jgi:hypothetical protein